MNRSCAHRIPVYGYPNLRASSHSVDWMLKRMTNPTAARRARRRSVAGLGPTSAAKKPRPRMQSSNGNMRWSGVRKALAGNPDPASARRILVPARKDRQRSRNTMTVACKGRMSAQRASDSPSLRWDTQKDYIKRPLLPSMLAGRKAAIDPAVCVVCFSSRFRTESLPLPG
jgi:hypothetical protein